MRHHPRDPTKNGAEQSIPHQHSTRCGSKCGFGPPRPGSEFEAMQGTLVDLYQQYTGTRYQVCRPEQANTESAGERSSSLTCEMRQKRRHRFPVRHGRQSRPRRSQGCPHSGEPSVHNRAARSERRCCRGREPSRLEPALPPPAAAPSEREGARDLVRERRWLAPDVLHIFNGRIARAARRRRAAALLPQTSSPGRRGPPLITTVG